MTDKTVEAVEQIVSAWAFGHNIDGATRNDLFARLRIHLPNALTRQAQVSDEEEHRRFFEAVEEMRSEAEGAVMDPKKRDWLKLTVQLAERALHQPASKAVQVSDDAVVERIGKVVAAEIDAIDEELATCVNVLDRAAWRKEASERIARAAISAMPATNSEAVSELVEALDDARDQLWLMSKDPDNCPLIKKCGDALAKLGSRAP
jgi:hypothetical protein